MVRYYRDGMAYTETSEDVTISDGTVHTKYTYTQDPTITIIDDIEYTIPHNAPKPFVYGAKIIIIMYSKTSKYRKYYDVRAGVIKSDNNFKGQDWLEKQKPNYIDTLTAREEEVYDDVLAKDTWKIVNLPKG
jgi:hypothetical protein